MSSSPSSIPLRPPQAPLTQCRARGSEIRGAGGNRLARPQHGAHEGALVRAAARRHTRRGTAKLASVGAEHPLDTAAPSFDGWLDRREPGMPSEHDTTAERAADASGQQRVVNAGTHHGGKSGCDAVPGQRALLGRLLYDYRDPTPRPPADWKFRPVASDRCVHRAEPAAGADSGTADQAPSPTSRLPVSAVINSKRDAVSGRR